MSMTVYSGSNAAEIAPGKRDSARTRKRILDAAQDVFSGKLYASARVGDIAALAGVNQALVIRYFGSKDRLYSDALEAILSASHLSEPDYPGLTGEAIVAGLLEGVGLPRNPLPMIFNAGWDAIAQPIAHDLMMQRIVTPLAARLGGPDGEVRAAEILAICAGVFVYRSLLPVAPFTGAMDGAARHWLVGVIQEIMDRPATIAHGTARPARVRPRSGRTKTAG